MGFSIQEEFNINVLWLNEFVEEEIIINEKVEKRNIVKLSFVRESMYYKGIFEKN